MLQKITRRSPSKMGKRTSQVASQTLWVHILPAINNKILVPLHPQVVSTGIPSNIVV